MSSTSSDRGLALPRAVDINDWVRRSIAAGPEKPVLNFEQFWDGELLIRLFDGPTPKGRRDFHINTRAEFFYQLQGDMVCTFIQNEEFTTVTCRQGEMFWIPPLVPHLNEREQGSIGLVIHTQRQPGALDGMAWYCDRCGAQVHRMDYAYDKELRELLGPKIREFAASEALRTCKRCHTVIEGDLGFI
jgi:3-hydroxyanthranilate 3,4-dioxygenase